MTRRRPFARSNGGASADERAGARAERDAIIEQSYRDGAAVAEIAAYIRTSANRVYQILRSRGVDVLPRPVDLAALSLPGEVWRPVPGFPGYSASSEGRIAGPRGIRRLTPVPAGYALISVITGGRHQTFCGHYFVALAWHGPKPSPAHTVAHDDGDPPNIRPDNLRWATMLEQSADKRRHGTLPRGERAGNAKLTDAAVREIRACHVRFSKIHGAAALGRRFGVEPFAIYRVVHGKGWTHVTDDPEARAA